MDLEKLLELKRSFDLNRIVFCYSGAVSQGIVEDIGDTLKQAI
jgi:hypothetical protein